MSASTVNNEDLLQALQSVNSIRRSALMSALLLLAGVAAVAGSVYYSATRLASMREELVALTAQTDALAERKAQLLDANRQSEAKLEETTRALQAAETALAAIETRGLSPQAREELKAAAANVDSAGKALAASKEALQSTASTPSIPNIGLTEAINGLFAPKAADRVQAYNVLIEKHASDPQLIPELITHARNNPKNQDGVYNALVTLSHLQKAELKPYVPEIKEFATSVASNGNRTKERADKLIARLPE